MVDSVIVALRSLRPGSERTRTRYLLSGMWKPPGRQSIPVVRTSELSRFHLSLLRRISSIGSGLSEYYKPDLWTPHITLARTGVNQRTLAEIIGKLARKEFELDITIDNLSTIQDDNGRYSVRSRFPFS